MYVCTVLLLEVIGYYMKSFRSGVGYFLVSYPKKEALDVPQVINPIAIVLGCTP